MLIEATHPEETRVVVVDGSRLEELDVETSTKKQIKGNIYLAKVIRVEPSLQAAFVDYGGNRHGFLAFNEIHPDYYQIPVADKEALKREIEEIRLAKQEALEAREKERAEKEALKEQQETDDVLTTEDDTEQETEERPAPSRFSIQHRYKIQEVIHHNQILLVQVMKEERGNKGAALTTYLSLAGRYSVLMPNNNDGGGVSRKISNGQDRRRLREIVDALPIPDGMSVIIRTAGKEQKKTEIKRDFEYLMKTWTAIRNKTLISNAPTLIHEEASLIKRTLRDVYSDEIEEVLIEGKDAYKATKEFIKLLMPKQAKRLKEYTGNEPLFQAYRIEEQLEEMHNPNVKLKSGGYLVINQTEALVAIDVNSGKATRERDIEETALNTNLEAAEEVARQLRLRDLAGLIVIDFIDMDEMRNNHAVERRMKEVLKKDRARVQMARLSCFGLMEISRQRLHPSFLEGSHNVCPCCKGRGVVRSVESCAMYILHLIEETAVDYENYTLLITLKKEVASYILNTKRKCLLDIEQKYNVVVRIETDMTFVSPMDFRFEKLRNSISKTQETSKSLKEQAKAEKKLKQQAEKEKAEKLKRQQAEKAEKLKQQQEKKAEKLKRQQEKAEKLKQQREQQKKKQEQTKIPEPEVIEEVIEKTEERPLPEENEDGAKKRHRKRRNKRYPKTENAENSEQNFKVVEQENLSSFENNSEIEAENSQEKPVKRPRKSRKKEVAEEVPHQEPSVQEQPAEEKKPPKKGWWNKLVS